MNILQYLDQKQISELEMITSEIYKYKPTKTTFVETSTASLTFLGGGAINAGGLGMAGTEGGILGALIGAVAAKNLPGNPERVAKNYQEIKEEREKQEFVEQYIEYSSFQIASTDAFNILSDVIIQKIETDIGKLTWSNLEEKSKLFITTAEVLREFLQVFNENLDYSPPTLNYCKAVENELNEKLLFPFKNFFKLKKLKLKNLDYDSKLSFILSSDTQNLKLTLGEHSYILRKILDNKKPTPIELEYKRFLMITNYQYLRDLNNRINIITKYYRNPSGHTEVMDQTKCLECRRFILAKNGILPSILCSFDVINSNFGY